MNGVAVLFIQGVSLGFTAAVSPGPFLAYVISETLAFGWRRSLVLTFVPFVSDVPAMIISVLILGQIPPEALRVIQVVGGLVILYMVWGMFRQLRQKVDMAQAVVPAQQHVFVRGVTMGLSSPGMWIFWTTINGPIIVSAWRQSPASALAYAAGFYCLLVSGLFGWIVLFHQARRLDERVVRGLRIASLVIMVGFAALLIRSGLLG